MHLNNRDGIVIKRICTAGQSASEQVRSCISSVDAVRSSKPETLKVGSDDAERLSQC